MRVLLLCLLTVVATAAHADDRDLRQKIVGRPARRSGMTPAFPR